MSTLNEATSTDDNNQSQPTVPDENTTPNITWMTVNIPAGRKKWIRIIIFSVVVLLLIAIIGIILGVTLTNKASTTFMTSSTTTTTTTTTVTITTDTTSSQDMCETYFNVKLPTYSCFIFSMAMEDVNDDGKVDIIYPECSNKRINIYFNMGSGIFGTPTTYLTGSASSSIGVADMNGDGKSDIIVTVRNSMNVGVFYNIGNDTFSDPATYLTSLEPLSAVLVDINEDHHLDIAVLSLTTNSLDILLNTGNGTFTEERAYVIDIGLSIIIAADVNNDNKLDIIVGSSDVDRPFKLFYINVIFHMGNSNLTVHTKLKTRDATYSIAVADINGDNAMDIIVASMMENIEIFFNTGNGTFLTTKLINSHGLLVHKAAAGDINGDNKVDIIFTTVNSRIIGILYDIGNNSSFHCLKTFSVASTVTYLTVADINGDKIPEIIVGTVDEIVILSFHCQVNCEIKN